jgi:hypothetical protein
MTASLNPKRAEIVRCERSRGRVWRHAPVQRKKSHAFRSDRGMQMQIGLLFIARLDAHCQMFCKILDWTILNEATSGALFEPASLKARGS